MRILCGTFLVAAVVAAGSTFAAAGEDDVVIENARMKLVIGSDARAKSLVVKSTGDERQIERSEFLGALAGVGATSAAFRACCAEHGAEWKANELIGGEGTPYCLTDEKPSLSPFALSLDSAGETILGNVLKPL